MNGSPPLALAMRNNVYVLECTTTTTANAYNFAKANVTSDIGKWTSWRVEYFPTENVSGYIRAFRDNVLIATIAWAGMNGSKWNWLTKPSNITHLNGYFKNAKAIEAFQDREINANNTVQLDMAWHAMAWSDCLIQSQSSASFIHSPSSTHCHSASYFHLLVNSLVVVQLQPLATGTERLVVASAE